MSQRLGDAIAKHDPVAVDFGGAAALLLVYIVAVVVVVRVRAPGARGLAGAAETLTELSRRVDRRRAAVALGAIVAVLTGLGALVAYSTSEAPYVRMFRLNEERTVPTSFNAVQILATATVALLLAYDSRGKDRLAWLAAALAFFGGAIDEAGNVHARFERHTGLPEDVAVAALALLVVAALIVLWPRLRASPPALALLLGGGVAVVVAQGFDSIDELWSERIVEEALELGAGTLLLLAMLTVLQRLQPADRVDIGRDHRGLPALLV